MAIDEALFYDRLPVNNIPPYPYLRGAEALYQEIFTQDWYFLDVRGRLRSLSPERIEASICKRNIQMLANSVLRWCKEKGALPKSLKDLVPSHLSSLQVCPVSRRGYSYSRGKSSFKIYCRGEHHLKCGLGKSEPSLRSKDHPESDESPKDTLSKEEKSRGQEE